MKLVNGYYVEKINSGKRGYRVLITKGFEKKSDSYNADEIGWFRTQKEAIEFCNINKHGKSN